MTPRTPLPRAALFAAGEALNATEEAEQLVRQVRRQHPTGPGDRDLADVLTALDRARRRIGEAMLTTKGGGATRDTPPASTHARRPRARGGSMLTRTTEEQLKVSLTQAIQRWLEEAMEKHAGDLPYVGENAAETMATTGIAVLRAVADAQSYLDQEGMLKEEDD